MIRTATRTALVVAAVLLPLLTGCGPSVPPGFGDVSDGGVYVTGTTEGSCTYDSNQHGVTFDFTLIGRKDAAIEMEVHRARPGKRSPGDDPGPIIAERIVRVYRGDIPDHIHAVVQLSRDRYDRRLTVCVINVTNYGPNIVNAPGQPPYKPRPH